jgi:hypothetical protein
VRVLAKPFKIIDAFGLTGTAAIGSFSASIKSNPRAFAGIVPGSWQHVAMSLDFEEKTTKLFVDGFLVESSSFSANVDVALLSAAAAKAYVGCTPTGTDCFDGTVDDVRLYGAPFSAAQVATLFQTTEPAILAPFCGDGQCTLGFENVSTCFKDCVVFGMRHVHTLVLFEAFLTLWIVVNCRLVWERSGGWEGRMRWWD